MNSGESRRWRLVTCECACAPELQFPGGRTIGDAILARPEYHDDEELAVIAWVRHRARRTMYHGVHLRGEHLLNVIFVPR